MLSRIPKLRISTLSSRFCHASAAATSVKGTRTHVRPFEEIPGPKSLPVVGSLHRHVANGGFSKIYKTHEKFFQEFGPIVRENVMGMDSVHISDPKEIEKVFRAEGKFPVRPIPFDALERYRKERGYSQPMVTVYGKEWHKMRQALAPKLMRPKKMLDNLQNFNAVATDAVTSLGKSRGEGKIEGVIENLEYELAKYTTEAIGTFVFDARFGLYEDPPRAEAVGFIQNAHVFLRSMICLVVGFEAILYKYFNTPSWKALCDSHDALYRIGGEFVRKRMDEIMAMADEEGNLPDGSTQSISLLTYLLLKNKDTPEEIVTQSLDMCFAGVETTAVTLVWLLYNIARHPHVQEKLHEEIISLVGEDGDLTVQDLKRIPYLRACLKESMRVFPPVGTHARALDHDIELNGYRVPAHTPIMPAVYAVMHSSEHYKDPQEFRPERFLRDGGDDLHAFANIPFGFGPRMCIGKRAAEMEIFLYVAKLTQRFRLECNHDPPEQILTVILSPENPILINVIDRDM